jgi:preprotein translocase subunit SecD
MRKEPRIHRITAYTLLISLLALSVPSRAAEDSVSFAVFEVVDCHSTGAKPMVLKGNPRKEKHCVAPHPIVDQTHLKTAVSATNTDGQPQLRVTLTEEGGKLMQKATQRIMGQGPVRGHLAIVVDDELLDVASVMSVVTDSMVIEGEGLTQKQVDEIAYLLQRKVQHKNQRQT